MKKYFVIIWLLTLCNSSFSQVVKFAAFGDFGGYAYFPPGGSGDLQVSNLVKSWDTDTSFFIITLGDNNYFSANGAASIDLNIGQFYHEYIYPYNNPGFSPGYGPNPQTKNRFFRGLGNHDLYVQPQFHDYLYFQFTNVNKGNTNAYPGGVRYYDFQKGNVHFFSYNTGIDPLYHNEPLNIVSEPDGIDSNSIQGQWLKQRMLQSTAKWKIVYMHHPPYYSHDQYPIDNLALLRFPFKEWGASIVLSGHWHWYERLHVEGLTYIIAGLGGAGFVPTLPQPRQGSQFLYTGKYGALLGHAYADSLVFRFINEDNQLIDYYKIEGSPSAYNGPWYVNDNSIIGDVYASSVGNNANAGTPAAPFATMNHAISVAQAGDTIYVDAGTYGENAVVNKRLTIIGAGNTTIVNPPTGACFQFTAGGTSAALRQVLKKIRLTASGDGILVSTANLQYFTFNNVKSDLNTGNGINLNTSWSVSPADIKVDTCDLSNNTVGLRLASNSNLNGLTITGGQMNSNAVQGFLSGSSGSTGVTNVSINGTSFTGNGTSEIGDQGDIIFFGFSGNTTISNVNINSDAGHGIEFRGNTPLVPAGNITLNNINITGTVKNKFGLRFTNYTNLTSVSTSNIIINTNPSPTFSGFAMGVSLDNIGAAVNLSGISFGNTHLGNGAGIDIELNGASNVNASGVTFSTINNFIIEDRIHHAIDVTGTGLVTWVANNVYVTTNSFYSPATTIASIQRGINAASNGFTVNVGNGTYNGDVNINKSLIVKGQSTAAIIRGLYAGNANTVLISASNATLKDVTVTRDYGANLAAWNASLKNQGISIAQSTTGTVIQNVILTGNRNAILVNDVQNVTITSCTIEDNYIGIYFGNNFSGAEVHNNFIRNNFTHGVLFDYDLAVGIVATNVHITDNSITGNWYSQANFQRNSGPVPSGNHSGLSFSCNWYGISTPTAVAANAAEPAYTSQTPSQFGGTNPGLNRQLYGVEIARCPYVPFLINGTDNDLVTAGFQSVPGACTGQPQTRLYVNDNSLMGDIYTSSVGNNANAGISSAPFATIAHAILVAQAGDTIYVDAGTYGENAVVNKRLTIIGAGNTTIVNPPTGACFQFTAGGTSAVLRQVLKKIRLTASGDGILVSTANLQYFTFNNVKSDLNTGNGINLNTSWSVSPADIKVDTCDLSNNTVGLRLVSTSNLNGLTITGGQMNSNAVQGFLSGSSGSTGVTNVSINGTSFTGNGSSEIGDQGDIIFSGFSGNTTISNVNINSDAGYGIEFRGNTPLVPAGNITLNNINITGTDKNKFGLRFINYTNLNSVSTSNMIINTNPSPTFSGFAMGVSLDNIGAAVNLSGISFGNAHLGNGAGIDIELSGSNNVNASGVTFSTADNFIIEDRIHHAIDVTGTGLVTWVANNVYVTTNSFYSPATTIASIQRGINAASNGFTVNVGNGTYNGDININKSLIVKGQSTAAIIRGLYAGDANTVLISASNATLKDITVTRDYGASVAEWKASTKNQGISIAQSTTGTVIQNVILTGNRNAILVNDVQNVTITSCTIEDNYIGIYFGNNFSGAEVHNNFIRNNFTHGVLFDYDLAVGIVATNVHITDNSITGNWYSQANFQRNSGPVPSGNHSGLSFSCNWYGTSVPLAVAANAAEPPYTSQTPSQFGETDPGLNRRLYGVEIARCPYVPFLINGTDNDLVTAGFQSVPGACTGQPQTRLYVNDNSLMGDIYTSSVGNNANAGISSAPFATIAHAILVAQAGDTIYVDAGTYGENAVVNKRLTIIGAGNTTIVNPPTGACFQFTAGGTSSVLRQVLKKIRLTASGDGILVSTANLQYFTFNNVKSDLNTGNGINLNTSWSVSPADIKVDTCDLSNNTVGLRLASTSNLNGLTITGGQMNSNAVQGFLSGSSGSTGVTNVSINGTSFTGNGSSEIGDQGDIIFSGFSGNTTISNVNINSDAGYGIEFRGNTPLVPAGNITLNNINITGTAKNKFGLRFINYTNLNSVSTSNMIINTNPSPTFSGFAMGVSLDNIGAAVNLSGISFGNAHLGNGAGIDIELNGASNVNASGVTFSTADNFIIEDRIHHAIDVTGAGLVTWDSNNVYVTTNSFYSPATTIASIQRGINAASNGFTVNVGNGTYNGDINIDKSLIVKGQSTAAIIRGLYAGDSNTVLISASNATLKDVTVTRDYGAYIGAWTASSKSQGISVVPLTTGIVIQNVTLAGNNNAILVNNALNVTITSCTIEDNYAGIFFRNNFSGAEVHNNFIRNNFTHGVWFNYDFEPGVVATNVHITDNSITGNWYSQVNFQRNSVPVPTGDHSGLSLSCNWYGTSVPSAVAVNAAEPDYIFLTPSQFGGTNPELNRQLYGVEIGKCPYMPWLTDGTDKDLITAGFQPVTDSCKGRLPITALNIKVIPEGFYNITNQKLNITDTVKAYLRSVISPYNVIDSAVSTIDSVTLTGSFVFPELIGTYYIVIKHRNTIETWSALGGETFTAGTIMNYDFTDSASKAYENNLIQVDSLPARFAIYSGDVDQDGVTDITDGSIIDNDYFNFVTGYVVTDLNADGIVDITDAAIQVNNAFNFVGVKKP